MTAVTAALAWQIRATPALDFDLSGFVFLLSNIGFLFAWGTVIAFAFGAVYCWTRMLLSANVRADYFS